MYRKWNGKQCFNFHIRKKIRQLFNNVSSLSYDRNNDESAGLFVGLSYHFEQNEYQM